MMHCVQCDAELVAPARSEYWSEKHACHIWHCPKCCACFSSLATFPADTDTDTESIKDVLTEDPSLFPSLLVA
jgi:hypothetical protein